MTLDGDDGRKQKKTREENKESCYIVQECNPNTTKEQQKREWGVETKPVSILVTFSV